VTGDVPAAAAPAASTPGAPPVFGASPPSGPPVSAATFAEAEKLMQVALTPAQREMAAGSWATTMAPLAGRRTGPHAQALPDALAPATTWHPASIGPQPAPRRDRFAASTPPVRPLAADDADIAYASVAQLAQWIASRALTSERLTRIYLDRIHRFDPVLRSVITVMPEHALAQARRADAEIAAGRHRGPLHGIPCGVKDLLDTKGIATTWGAEPLRDHVPASDATVVRRLEAAGAVLLAKLSLGALALNDVWFGGQTMNPWLPEEGSSGSSAGPGAATAAALVAFAIGSETGGSIVSPSMRCGVTGLRPTFGRVPRTGAMTLCWSLDKLGPMTRHVEDAMLVLRAISGPDGQDVSCVKAPLDFDARAAVKGLTIGYVDAWMKEDPATDVDRAALETAKALGLRAVPVTLPGRPYEALDAILFAESAASFEAWTADGRLDRLRMQVPDAWPNTFRMSRFVSAVDFVQAERLRRLVAQDMAALMSQVDLLLVPSLRGEMLTISNHTGHPSLTLRTGSVTVDEPRSDWAPDPAHPAAKFASPRAVPHGVTLIGRLFDEGTIARVGMALERAANVSMLRPAGF
jgi:Asp-tRNA(Asn)/Glu-tRNA(Gln) amidotransferase A subunit family amidase